MEYILFFFLIPEELQFLIMYRIIKNVNRDEQEKCRIMINN